MSVILLVVALVVIACVAACGMYLWLWMLRRTGAYLARMNTEGSGPDDPEDTIRIANR